MLLLSLTYFFELSLLTSNSTKDITLSFLEVLLARSFFFLHKSCSVTHYTGHQLVDFCIVIVNSVSDCYKLPYSILLETSNAVPDDEEYTMLLYAQYSHSTYLSAVQTGMKVQPLNLLWVIHGTANHCIVRSSGKGPLSFDIVGWVTCPPPTVASTP